MHKPVQITIPTPCHEKWDEMTPTDKGRFCAAYQKNLIDFTKASDREIVQTINSNKNLCGRFSPSQLDRDLIVFKEKNTAWTAIAAGVITFITLGLNKSTAQETVKTEQTDSKTTTSKNTQEEYKITGIVRDYAGELPSATIINVTRNTETASDLNGRFEITVFEGDIIEIRFVSYENYSFTAKNKEYNILLEESKSLREVQKDVYGVIEVKRTFFGRIFHSIGNIFR